LSVGPDTVLRGIPWRVPRLPWPYGTLLFAGEV